MEFEQIVPLLLVVSCCCGAGQDAARGREAHVWPYADADAGLIPTAC